MGSFRVTEGVFEAAVGERELGEALRHLAQEELWGKNRDAQRVFVFVF